MARTQAGDLLEGDLLSVGRTSSQPAILAATFALGVTSFFFVRILPLIPFLSSWSILRTLRDKLYLSGWIPLAIVWASFFGLFYLYQIWRRKVLPVLFAERFESDVIEYGSRGNDQHLLAVLQNRTKGGRAGYYTLRFTRLWNQAAPPRNGDIATLQRLREEILQFDEEDYHNAFAAVRWSEWALPLLGFLGTVVGIGQAVGSLKGGVAPDDAGTLTVQPTAIQGSFSGMATAFETTFEGLVGLLVVGTCHALLKKRVGAALNRAGDIFTRALENWRLRPAPTAVTAATVELRLGVLESNLSSFRTDVGRAWLKARVEREHLLGTAEAIIQEDPRFDSIRRILFRPMVEFEAIYAKLSAETSAFITGQLGGKQDWEFLALSAAPDSDECIALIRRRLEQRTYLYPFRIKESREQPLLTLNGQFDGIRLCANGNTLLRDADGAFYWFQNRIPARLAEKYRSPMALPWSIPLQQIPSALVAEQYGSDLRFHVLPFGTEKGRTLGQTPPGVNWKLGCFYPGAPMTVWIAGTHERRKEEWNLLRIDVKASQSEQPQNPASDVRAAAPPVISMSTPIPLAIDTQLSQIVAPASGAIVLVTTDGKLLYFEKEMDRPVRLSHADWSTTGHVYLVAGPRGWFGLHTNGKLSMWQLRSGRLQPYYGTPAELKAEIEPQKLNVTHDGRYCLCAQGQQLLVWSFPEHQLDATRTGEK